MAGDLPISAALRLPSDALAQFDGALRHRPAANLRLQRRLHPPGAGRADAPHARLRFRSTSRWVKVGGGLTWSPGYKHIDTRYIFEHH